MPEPDPAAWPDENKLLLRLRRRIASNSTAMLDKVSGLWEEPYLRLRFEDADGGPLEVLHGDGYTAITADQVDFHGSVSTKELELVLCGMLDGTTRYVVGRKAGIKVTEHFEVAGGRAKIGIHTGGPAFLPRYVFGKLLPLRTRTSGVCL